MKLPLADLRSEVKLRRSLVSAVFRRGIQAPRDLARDSPFPFELE